MSWDIFAMDLPESVAALRDVPEGFVGRPIGTRASITHKITRAVPFADFSQPAWGKVQIPGCEMEINLGDNEEVKTIAFHVYGGDLAPGVMVAILRELELRAVDSMTGEIFNEETAAQSYKRWLDYRSQVIRGQTSC
jgi:hypothetical protein